MLPPLCLGTRLFINLFHALIFLFFVFEKTEKEQRKSRTHKTGSTREFNMYYFIWKNDAGLPMMIPFFKIRRHVVSDKCAACKYFYFLFVLVTLKQALITMFLMNNQAGHIYFLNSRVRLEIPVPGKKLL